MLQYKLAVHKRCSCEPLPASRVSRRLTIQKVGGERALALGIHLVGLPGLMGQQVPERLRLHNQAYKQPAFTDAEILCASVALYGLLSGMHRRVRASGDKCCVQETVLCCDPMPADMLLA